MDANQARTTRAIRRAHNEANLEEDELDEDFNKNVVKALKKMDKQEKGPMNEKRKIEFFGHRMEAFNMKDDREMGKIEKDGFFVYDRKKDNELRDPWLDSLEEMDDPYADDKKIPEPKKKEAKEEEDEGPMTEEEMDKLKFELCQLLNKEETANQALIRLGKKNKPAFQKKFSKNVRKKVKTGENEGVNVVPEEKKDAQAQQEQNPEDEKKFLRIVEICDMLCSAGYVKVYTDPRERIIVDLPTELKKIIRAQDQPKPTPTETTETTGVTENNGTINQAPTETA